MKYSVVLPCRNEEKTIGICIKKAFAVLGKDCEVIVVDNNSTDASAAMARRAGAIVIKEKTQGYGAALLRGFSVAHGEHIIMCDADNTYDLSELPRLLKFKNHDLVIGNRFNKSMKKGSMTFLHKYIGNPLLSLILRTFFNAQTRDTHSGFRLIKKSAIEKMRLSSAGMELASEMVLKAARLKFKIKEVPISYSSREGISKLSSFKDGWKHLRLMLLYSPDYLYLVPGFIIFLIGLILMIALLQGPLELSGLKFYVHPMFVGSLLTILGYQIILLWLFSRVYMITYLDDMDKSSNNKRMKKVLSYLSLEKGLILGIILFVVGLAININTLMIWINSHFGALYDIKGSIFGLTLILLGSQTFFSSFYLSILGMRNEGRQ